MSEKYGDGGSGSTGRNQGFFPDEISNTLSDAAENLRAMFDQHIGLRLGRGDVRGAILRLLIEEPMHGHQIISAIETRTNGVWKPSPGSVYPTLQLLVDEGLVTVQESDGKKLYTLTESGKLAAKSEGSAPWETTSARDSACSSHLPKAGAKLAQATAQVGRSGTPEQVTEAVAVLDDARRKLYAILAQE